MGEGTGILPGLPAVAGKPVHVSFDGGRLTSDGGILLLAAVEQRLKIAERLAACIEDRRDPDRVVHHAAPRATSPRPQARRRARQAPNRRDPAAEQSGRMRGNVL